VFGVFQSCALYSLLAFGMARILIVDDNESMRVALKTLFALRPHWEICGEAEDGSEAVAKASQLQPDMIVLDFKMPLSNGLQAAGEISRTMPSTPIVMYAFYWNADLEIIAKLAGIWRVVAKENGVQRIAKYDGRRTGRQGIQKEIPTCVSLWRGRVPLVLYQ
jgi:chemotaxis response regulator CheB